MKRFYLHNGTEQQGPFDIEELKTKNISRETPIWYEGLVEWTTAEKVEDLKSLFKSTPPPLGTTKVIPPPLQKTQAQVATKPTKKKKNTFGRIFQSIVILAVIIFIVTIITLVAGYFISDNGVSVDTETYQEKVMTVEEIERSQPTNFLTASGNYTENFWGTKIKVHGVITNTATVATYKDAVVKISYYSKTKTELGSEKYTIYEVFPPNSTTPFELKIENYKNVNSIGWEVINATAN